MKSTLIGVTGGIGSGKSIVCRILSAMNYPVYDADKEAAKMLDFDDGVKSKVKILLGEKSFLPTGFPDRIYISSVVFTDPAKLEALNDIIHPAVHSHFHSWVNQHRHKELLFKEAAIMFESGSYKDMDFVIAVTAPESIRIERVMQRDNKSEAQVKHIISKQLPESEVIERSDFEIKNDDEHLVIHQLLEILKQIEFQRKK